MFPTPPSELPVVAVEVEEAPSEPFQEDVEEPKEAVIAVETIVIETEEQEEEEVIVLEPMDTSDSDSDGESLAPSQASQAFVTAAIEVVSTEAQEPESEAKEKEDEDDEDKGAESDDDFEDAEEEVYKPTEEEIKAREAKREQSERASRLIGQKMLQGWAMLQDPCPNADCHGVRVFFLFHAIFFSFPVFMDLTKCDISRRCHCRFHC